MRQVPHYLLIGNGAVAQHFQHYFSLLKIPFTTWHRTQSEKNLAQKIAFATHILLLISDQAIEPFIKKYLKNTLKKIIHFSGAHTSKIAHSAHPLMTFSKKLYTLEHYKKIPFILEKKTGLFKQLLPGLPNSHFYLEKKQKAKYHALCVASGNFSCLLWQKLFETFEKEFHLPKEAAYLYLKQQTDNLITNSKNALTGPLVRNDTETIKKNLAALTGDPLQKIYKTFLGYYQKAKGENI